MKKSRAAGFIVIALAYLVAIAIGVAVFLSTVEMHLFWRVFLGDLAATIFVFLTGVIYQNASVYDPYWSVAPIVIIGGLVAYSGHISSSSFLLLIVIFFWGVRLTANWAYTFANLATQDWRYDDFKQRYPKSFQIISFFGINLFPTLVVYLCLLPAIVFLETNLANKWTLVGVAVCLIGTTLELLADRQMHQFRSQRNRDEIVRVGLWQHSRHPNYLGEIMMWWGVYLMMLSTTLSTWWLAIGALVNTLMFLRISIPMADKRNRVLRQNYDDYYRETNNLVPLRLSYRKQES